MGCEREELTSGFLQKSVGRKPAVLLGRISAQLWECREWNAQVGSRNG
jgi:hypothetical protein